MGPLLKRVLGALALWCLVLNTRETAGCIAAERDALVAFNASIKDPRERLSSWKGENCCNWSGVRCSKKTGHVIQLDLGKHNLEGEINPSLAGLTNLVYLNLSQSNFSGVNIPEFMGSFKKLRYLDLSHAGFSGTVPPQLGNLSRLIYLNLSSSFPVIKVDSFYWVSKLTYLRYLDLSWLYLVASMDWLQAVNMLPLLEVIRLNDAYLPVTNLNCLPQVNFTALQMLDLKNNNLNSSFPNWIWNRSSVSELDLSSCGLYGRIPDELGKLKSLKFLALADNMLKGALPQPASRPCNLVHIDLSRNLFSGDITKTAKNLLPCMKRLQILDLSDNKLEGNISAGWLEQMTSLRVLDLSMNSISGDVPASMGKLSNLTHLDISFNSFEGTLSELHFLNLSRLETLVLSSNSLKIVMKHGWMPPFQLKELGMHDCLVGPQFPTWLQSQTRIEMVDLGSAGISGVLPDWIWNFSSSITSLNVSTNNISGKLPASLAHLKMLTTLNMRYNQLEGSIPDLPTRVQVLDLSQNHLSGSFPQSFREIELYFLLLSNNSLSGGLPADLCNMLRMEVIDLSSNNLSGVLPDCWNKSSNLYIIDFSSNKFWGEIPSTLGSLNSLITLHLGRNDLSGTLPTSLQSLNRLVLLDLGENNFSGNIPKWIGVGLQSLQFLSLRSNQFSGEIPEELFQLHALQFLDFGNNKLSGPVPHSIGNLTNYLDGQLLMWDELPFIEYRVYGVGGAYFSLYRDALSFTWKGELLLFRRILALLNIIDLSQNQLTGEIPSELGHLTNLRMLNLSRNCIEGSIPGEFGRLTNLEVLDLSWNNLSGPIPQSLTSLYSLDTLNLSYNDLSGKIPIGPELSTFYGDSYSGNANLCGPPLSRVCLPSSSNHYPRKDRWKHFDTVTYMCTLLGFATGFSIVCLTLISSEATRKAYFQFADGVLDKLQAAADMKLNINRRLAGRDLSIPTASQNSITLYNFGGPSTAA